MCEDTSVIIYFPDATAALFVKLFCVISRINTRVPSDPGEDAQQTKKDKKLEGTLVTLLI